MFDAYHKWLGIPRDRRPPTYYDLLGIDPAEQDVEVIDGAALRQIAHVRTFQAGPHAADCARVLGELALARRTLTSPDRRSEYDARIATVRVEPPTGLHLPGPAGPAIAPIPSMVVTEPEPIQSRATGSARWLAPFLASSVLTLGVVASAWLGWIPGVRLSGHRPVAEPVRPIVQVEQPTDPDSGPPRIAQADPVAPGPTPKPTPPPSQPTAAPAGPIPRAAVVAMLAPRPDDTLPDLPDPVDPNAAFLDVTFEPADAHPRLIADFVSRHALHGPGRVVEMFDKVPRTGGQVVLGLNQPGFLPIQDKPVNLVPGQRIVVQVRMAPEGTPAAEVVRVAARTPLAGSAPGPVAAATPPAQPANPSPAPAAPVGRTIEGTPYTANLGRLPVRDLAISADGQHVLIAYGDVRSFNLETGRPESSSDGQIQNATAVAASPTGTGFVATGSADGYVATWNASGKSWVRGRPRPVVNKNKTPVKLIRYSPDGKLLAGTIDNHVTLVRPEGTNLVVGEFKFTSRLRGLAFGPDTLWIADDAKVEAYNLGKLPPKPIDRPDLLSALASGPPIVALAAHPDGERLFVARDGGVIQEWNVESGEPTRTIANEAGSPIAGIRLSNDGARLAAFGDARVRVYNVANGQIEARLIGHAAPVIDAEFLPGDSRVIVSLGSEPSLRVWDLDVAGAANKRPWDPAEPGSLVPDRPKNPARPGMP